MYIPQLLEFERTRGFTREDAIIIISLHRSLNKKTALNAKCRLLQAAKPERI